MSIDRRRGPRNGPAPVLSPEGVAIAQAWCDKWEAMTEAERNAWDANLAEAIREDSNSRRPA